jgi:opacity protein-like surface antigen
MKRGFIVSAALALAIAAPAAAQTRPAAQPRPLAGPASEPRVFADFNGGFQPAGSALNDRLEFEQYLETASADVRYATKSAPWFGGGIGVRAWKRLGVGIAFSTFSRDDSAGIDARIPHPFQFARLREISGEAASHDVKEAAIHGQLLFIVPARGRLRMILSGGPSRIEAERGIVTAVRFDEEFPFDTATFRTADTRVMTEAKIGFNVGADVAYMFSRTIGVGGIVRFSRATVDFARPDGGRVSVEAGGFQAGAGLRFAFSGPRRTPRAPAPPRR